MATVNRISPDPSKVRFEHVSAVAQVLGVNLIATRRIPVKKLLQTRAAEKANYVARLMQGTQGLEAAGVEVAGFERLVEVAGFERLVEVATAARLAGKKESSGMTSDLGWDPIPGETPIDDISGLLVKGIVSRSRDLITSAHPLRVQWTEIALDPP